jgi:hypothetical protein
MFIDLYWWSWTDELGTGTTGTWTGSRIEIPEHSSGSELLFSLLNNNKQGIDENANNKISNQTMNKTNERIKAQMNK